MPLQVLMTASCVLHASCRRWGVKTAPPPSLWLVAPVAAFCAAATFVAVYWPRRVQPDGGRGSLEGAGAAALANPVPDPCPSPRSTQT